MKKVSILVCALTAVFTFTISSCKLKIEDENLFDKPGVIITDSQVTVIIPKMSSDTKYVNVYRRDKSNNDIQNIGILFHPEALENDNKNYCYPDTLVKKSHVYDYRVRYKIDGDYFYSDWSNAITIPSTSSFYDDSDVLKYQASGISIEYSSSNYTIIFTDGNATLTPPTNPAITNYTADFTPMLIVESGSASQVLPLLSAGETTATYDFSGTIPLRGFLPQNFMDTDIQIKGILGQKKILNGSSTKAIIWTEPTEINVLGAGSDRIINVPSQTGSSGLDYSRSAQ